jgi:hypothetical protein
VVAVGEGDNVVVNKGCAGSFLDLCFSRIELGVAGVLEDSLVEECGILWDEAKGNFRERANFMS